MTQTAGETADGFFLDHDNAPLQQGDLLLAPVVRLASAGVPTPGGGAGAGGSAQLLNTATGRVVSAAVEVPPPAPELGPAPNAQAGWAPVIVVSHDCQLDKEFNRRYQQLRDQGASKADAVRAAETDPSLDRWLMVAPILDLNSAAEDESARQLASSAARGDIVGLFPVPPNPSFGIVGGVADLTWVSTIDRHTVAARLASISTAARGRFRLALARTAALRTPELGFALEDIIGDRIDAAEKVPGSPLEVELTLRKNGTLRLLAQPGEPPSGGPHRTKDSAPGGS